MSREQWKGLLILSSALGVIGLILLFGSVSFGTAVAESWLVNQANGVDTSFYELIVQGNINNFLAAGSILLTVGLAATAIVFYKYIAFEK